MSLESHNYNYQFRNLQEKCRQHMYYLVTMTMIDGSSMDGVIEKVDSDSISMLVGEDVVEQESGNQMDSREFGAYGRPRRRFRRFRRRTFPIATIAALALLPYISPYSYYQYPYYPYY
ncbi:hypothetical protein [Bacillus tianshenii]|nr:hypothetical protein [Bacillus tianshenii]